MVRKDNISVMLMFLFFENFLNFAFQICHLLYIIK